MKHTYPQLVEMIEKFVASDLVSEVEVRFSNGLIVQDVTKAWESKGLIHLQQVEPMTMVAHVEDLAMVVAKFEFMACQEAGVEPNALAVLAYLNDPRKRAA